MANTNLRFSLRVKFLLPLLLGGAATAFVAAWVSYQSALRQLQNQLIERQNLLATTINEVIEVMDSDDEIRFAVDVIVRREVGVHGISVATKDPFVIWASSSHPNTDRDVMTQELLTVMMTSVEQGLFGHYFEENGDLVASQPLWPRGSKHQPNNRDLSLINTARRDLMRMGIGSDQAQSSPPFSAESLLRLSPTAYRGVIYLRFNWATVKQAAGGILWESAFIMLSGIVLLMVLTYLILRYTVLRPLHGIGEAIRRQEEGDAEARFYTKRKDEFGQIGRAFNQMLDALNERDRRFRTVVDYLPVAVSLQDINGSYRLTNRQFKEWFRTAEHTNPSRDSVGQLAKVNPTKADWVALEQQVLETGTHVTSEEKLSAPDGSTQYFVTTHFPVHDGKGVVTAIGSASTNITERKTAEKRIARLAYYDNLTDAPNRRLFQDRLQQALLHAQREGKHVGIFYLDLDGFKDVNDTLGHRVGDRLLQSTARRLKECVREQDTVARMGGDEFTVIIGDLEEASSGEVLVTIADKIMATFVHPFKIDEHEIFITTSIGIALFPQDGTHIEALTKNADTAMYHSKSTGRDNYQFFRKEMNVAARKRHQIEKHLRKALAQEELTICYQPQIDSCTERVVGVEALLRWNNTELGRVPPAVFIAVAEDTGLIESIGKWVLQRACQQLRDWRDEGVSLPRIAVNLSPRQMRHTSLSQVIGRILADTNLDPRSLEIEITERVFLQDPDSATSTLNELKALGIGLAMDDFGTGFSSLSYLRRLPIDTVKIDRSFIKDIPYHSDDAGIVTAIIAMAQGLELDVVAEGVETKQQLAFLKALGCNRVQGLLTGAPMYADALNEWLEQRV